MVGDTTTTPIRMIPRHGTAIIKFEAYHKTAGYFAGFFAVGAVASGLMQYPMPVLTGVVLITTLVALVLCTVLEHKGLRYDGYRAAFGNNPAHPHNKARKDL